MFYLLALASLFLLSANFLFAEKFTDRGGSRTGMIRKPNMLLVVNITTFIKIKCIIYNHYYLFNQKKSGTSSLRTSVI